MAYDRVRTNVGQKPPKKKKPAVKTETKLVGTVETTPSSMSVTPGKDTRTYTPARTFTNHEAYGNENPSNKDPQHVIEAREKKQEIAYDKDGKPYRAGYRETTTSPAKYSFTPPKPTLKFSTVKTKEIAPEEKDAKKKKKKVYRLKPMSMTYGTDSPKRGGDTKYVKRVRK